MKIRMKFGIALIVGLIGTSTVSAEGWRHNSFGQTYKNEFLPGGKLHAVSLNPDGSRKEDTGRWWVTKEGGRCHSYDHWQPGKVFCGR